MVWIASAKLPRLSGIGRNPGVGLRILPYLRAERRRRQRDLLHDLAAGQLR